VGGGADCGRIRIAYFHDEKGDKGEVPKDFAFNLLEDDWDQFEMLFTGAMERIPALETLTAEVQMVNGPESFTDNQYILGEGSGTR